jgi:hypothetical protein
MNSLKISNVEYSTNAQAHAEYFYDMLNQLLVIGRQAGGDALIDATLIGGLLASRRAQKAALSTDRRHTA